MGDPPRLPGEFGRAPGDVPAGGPGAEQVGVRSHRDMVRSAMALDQVPHRRNGLPGTRQLVRQGHAAVLGGKQAPSRSQRPAGPVQLCGQVNLDRRLRLLRARFQPVPHPPDDLLQLQRRGGSEHRIGRGR
ncbi:hypothetical protein [Streptomyces sp. NPDC102437]|uniref:hypothetical protein n=1 Tax=Streptomyces sp. NPDC102437 TaxID=3366175 RepID=UPI0038206DBE